MSERYSTSLGFQFHKDSPTFRPFKIKGYSKQDTPRIESQNRRIFSRLGAFSSPFFFLF